MVVYRQFITLEVALDLFRLVAASRVNQANLLMGRRFGLRQALIAQC
jgi:hypothetical protein